jgi:endonuclease/exonuclease/phosphatase family metal-dependent hydrolase
MTGKSIYGSHITTELALPQQNKFPILANNGLQQFTGSFWGNHYTIYARTWLPTSHLFNHYHVVIDQNNQATVNTETANKLNILTYNTQLMPFYAGTVDDLNQPGIRAKSIPGKITHYDVVLLEELFDKNLREILIKLTQAAYPYHTRVVGDHSSSLLTGGVMIFSKWPIIKEEQFIFEAKSGIDQFAAKGAIYAAINKDGKIYHLIGTHLQAGETDIETNIRAKQLQEIKNFIDRLLIPNTQPLLIGGDFNIDQFSREIYGLLNTLNVNLPISTGHPYSFDNAINTMSIGKSRSRLDYIFFHNAHENPHISINNVFILRDLNNEIMWPKFDLSDHFPLAGFFDFTPAIN